MGYVLGNTSWDTKLANLFRPQHTECSMTHIGFRALSADLATAEGLTKKVRSEVTQSSENMKDPE